VCAHARRHHLAEQANRRCPVHVSGGDDLRIERLACIEPCVENRMLFGGYADLRSAEPPF
jgi:hypothetical protein